MKKLLTILSLSLLWCGSDKVHRFYNQDIQWIMEVKDDNPRISSWEWVSAIVADVDIDWDMKPDWRFFLNNWAFSWYPVDGWGIIDKDVPAWLMTKQYPNWTEFFIKYRWTIAYDALSFHAEDDVIEVKQLTKAEADSIRLSLLRNKTK